MANWHNRQISKRQEEIKAIKMLNRERYCVFTAQSHFDASLTAEGFYSIEATLRDMGYEEELEELPMSCHTFAFRTFPCMKQTRPLSDKGRLTPACHTL